MKGGREDQRKEGRKEGKSAPLLARTRRIDGLDVSEGREEGSTAWFQQDSDRKLGLFVKLADSVGPSCGDWRSERASEEGKERGIETGGGRKQESLAAAFTVIP